MAFSFNGIGTTFYGERDFLSDGSYVTTEWVVFLALPLVPLRSLRVRPRGYRTTALGSESGFEVLGEFPPNAAQVAFTWGFCVSFLPWAGLVARVIGALFPNGPMPGGDEAYLVVGLICLAPISLPFILRHLARRRLGSLLVLKPTSEAPAAVSPQPQPVRPFSLAAGIGILRDAIRHDGYPFLVFSVGAAVALAGIALAVYSHRDFLDPRKNYELVTSHRDVVISRQPMSGTEANEREQSKTRSGGLLGGLAGVGLAISQTADVSRALRTAMAQKRPRPD